MLVTPADAVEEEEEEEEEEDGRAARFWWREQAVAKRSRSVLKAADCVTFIVGVGRGIRRQAERGSCDVT